MNIKELENLNKEISDMATKTGNELKDMHKSSGVYKDILEVHEQLQDTHMKIFNLVKGIKRG